MKFIKSIFIFCTLATILHSCGGFKEAGSVLRNEKSASTDEFLIKKKKPLTTPPDFNSVPNPRSSENRADKNKDNIKEVLNTSKSKSNDTQSKPSSLEDSILNKIRK